MPRKIPAYPSERSFWECIRRIHQEEPSRITLRLLQRWFGRATAAHLYSALRFLRLIDAAEAPTTNLRLLAAGSPDVRRDALRTVVQTAYRPLLGDLESAGGTLSVEEALRRYSISGSTVSKAARFFRHLAEQAEIDVPQERGGEAKAVRTVPPPPASQRTFQFLSGAVLTLLLDTDLFALPRGEREFVSSLLDRLQEYEEQMELQKGAVDPQDLPFE